MPDKLTDGQIGALLAEHKFLPADYPHRIALKPKRGHTERELDVTGDASSEFRVILRQGQFNPLSFSVILVYRVPGSNQVFRLRRYNGKDHQHTNKLEGNTFYDFHIHTATERYQDIGLREDAHAEVTGRYADFVGAVQCMLEDCGFELPPQSQGQLF